MAGFLGVGWRDCRLVAEQGGGSCKAPGLRTCRYRGVAGRFVAAAVAVAVAGVEEGVGIDKGSSGVGRNTRERREWVSRGFAVVTAAVAAVVAGETGCAAVVEVVVGRYSGLVIPYRP